MDKANCQCWRCGAELVDIILPFSRREDCGQCDADLHVCKMCKSYDARVANQCHEDRADAPNDKTRANFCDYFTLNTQAYVGKTKDSGAALTAAEALFGNAPAQEEDKLKGDHTVSEHEAKSAAAREELKKLFGDE